MWCGDVVLIGNKVGTVTGVSEDGLTAAMCDGTTQALPLEAVSGVVSDALNTVKSFEEAICRQGQS